LFQHPPFVAHYHFHFDDEVAADFLLEKSARTAQWMLKQVQHDEENCPDVERRWQISA
jgi:hypothetical protein